MRFYACTTITAFALEFRLLVGCLESLRSFGGIRFHCLACVPMIQSGSSVVEGSWVAFAIAAITGIDVVEVASYLVLILVDAVVTATSVKVVFDGLTSTFHRIHRRLHYGTSTMGSLAFLEDLMD